MLATVRFMPEKGPSGLFRGLLSAPSRDEGCRATRSDKTIRDGVPRRAGRLDMKERCIVHGRDGPGSILGTPEDLHKGHTESKADFHMVIVCWAWMRKGWRAHPLSSSLGVAKSEKKKLQVQFPIVISTDKQHGCTCVPLKAEPLIFDAAGSQGLDSTGRPLLVSSPLRDSLQPTARALVGPRKFVCGGPAGGGAWMHDCSNCSRPNPPVQQQNEHDGVMQALPSLPVLDRIMPDRPLRRIESRWEMDDVTGSRDTRMCCQAAKRGSA